MSSIIIRPTDCIDLGGAAYRVCLPPRLVCDNEGDGNSVIVGLGEAWCNYCQVDSKYSIPYIAGDEIHIQTQFFDSYNPNPKNPASGFGSFITAFITDGVTRIAVNTGMVAYGCKRSFQVLRIDTTNLALSNWVVEINVHNTEGDIRKTLQTQQYEEVSPEYCGSTLLLQGKGRGIDCFGNCYETPDKFTGEEIVYNNQMRFWASIKDVGGNFDKGGSTGGYFSANSIEDYRLNLTRKIPPFAKRVLVNQILPAPELLIDGESYDLESFKVDNDVRRGKMFLFGVDLERNCNSGNC